MLLSLALLSMTPPKDIAALDWLIGTWCTDPGDGEQTCETWTDYDRVGEARGVSVTQGPRGTKREKMTITNDAGRLVLHAEPEGQPAADFYWTTRDYAPSELNLVNEKHDYPQRVRYWREGKLLIAEISLLDGSKAMRWKFHRAK